MRNAILLSVVIGLVLKKTTRIRSDVAISNVLTTFTSFHRGSKSDRLEDGERGLVHQHHLADKTLLEVGTFGLRLGRILGTGLLLLSFLNNA
jgi:hypothetical protein